MNEFPDVSQEIAYTIVVTNLGTVTLANVRATSPGGAFICDGVDQPVAVLGVGDSYRCTESRQVGVAVSLLSALGEQAAQARLTGSSQGAELPGLALSMLHVWGRCHNDRTRRASDHCPPCACPCALTGPLHPRSPKPISTLGASRPPPRCPPIPPARTVRL